MALVLTRYSGERIFIDDSISGDRIIIQIGFISNNKVNVSITADDHYKILREEVYERIHEN